MDNIFYTGKQNTGLGLRDCIIIPRKLSQIPPGINIELMSAAGYCVLDGPNNEVTYEFPNED